MRHNPKTRSKQTQPKPRFSVGEMAVLGRYLPPLLSGTQVIVQGVVNTGREYRYQVESTEYAGAAWAHEDDLRLPLEGE